MPAVPNTQQGAGLPGWIADVNELALGWYTALRRPDQAINVLRPPTAQVQFGTNGLSATVDPNLLILGAIAVVAVIWIMNQ